MRIGQSAADEDADSGAMAIGRAGHVGSETQRLSERAGAESFERKRATAPATPHAVGERKRGGDVDRGMKFEIVGEQSCTLAVMLLVETSNCRWCDDVQPAWTAMSALTLRLEHAGYACVDCDAIGDELKQFAAKYLAAKS